MDTRASRHTEKGIGFIPTKGFKPTPAIKELETSEIERKVMDWRTENNDIDCGVFTMRHMETYKGEKTPWVTGFVKENEVNNIQCSSPKA
ncbi:hypothetical protein HanPI659440_Chr11g0421251 [Helianthus annuus]|nr:hypothetical protein HanPI659440_Chr11g0421251 [Helianthus annuus]